MGNKINFWTPGELNVVRETISKFKSTRRACKHLHAAFQHRSYAAIYQKVWAMRTKMDNEVSVTPVTTITATATPAEPKSITVPKGFTFDITPSRAVLFEDHVRLYF